MDEEKEKPVVSRDEIDRRRLSKAALDQSGYTGIAERLVGAGRRGEDSDNDYHRWYPDSLNVMMHRKIAWRAGPMASRCS